MKITSAYANKILKQLEDDKNYLVEKERTSWTYDAADGETPVIPDYSFEEVNAGLKEIDEKIRKIKHALNMFNAAAQIDVEGNIMSVDEILISMAQLNQRKINLDVMRKLQPKQRLQLRTLRPSVNSVPEYRYINFDQDTVKKEYEKVNEKIMLMQIALDKYNQTVEFEVEL